MDGEHFGGLYAGPEALTDHLRRIGLAEGPRMLLEQLWHSSRKSGGRSARQVSLPKLAQELGVCRRTIIHWRDDLISYGFLTTQAPPFGRALILIVDMTKVWDCGRLPDAPTNDATDDATDDAIDSATYGATDSANNDATDDATAAHTSFDLELKDLSINHSSDIQSDRSIDPSDSEGEEEPPLAAFETATPPATVHALARQWFDDSPGLQRHAFDDVLGAVLAARSAEGIVDFPAYIRRCLANGVRSGWIKRARDLIHQVAPPERPKTATQQQLEQMRERPHKAIPERPPGMSFRDWAEQLRADRC